MKLKNERYCITVTKDNINTWIASLMQARNTYIDEGKPVEDVTELLAMFLKAKKKLRA